MTHGAAVREVGALALSGTATTLAAQDDANAAGISSGSRPSPARCPHAASEYSDTECAGHPRGSGGGWPLCRAKLIRKPSTAVLGSSSLHSFAEQWEQTSAQLRQTAATTTQAADAIDANWEDGKQRAGANTRRHGGWLSHMSEQAHTLADHARSVAQNFETAKQSTPSPQEFAQARQELAQAMSRFQASRGANALEVQEKTHNLARKQAEATASAADYHSSVSRSTLSAMGDQIKTAPPIVGGGGDGFAGRSGHGEVDNAAWKPGDKRHYPIIRGAGRIWARLSPADGPGWVEIGPRSGNFVRPDELPGLKMQNPGELGPAPFYDLQWRRTPLHRTGPWQRRLGARHRLSRRADQKPGGIGTVRVRGVPTGIREFGCRAEDLIPDPRDPDTAELRADRARQLHSVDGFRHGPRRRMGQRNRGRDGSTPWLGSGLDR